MRKVLYIFGLLTDADIDWMARVGIRRRLKDGEILIEQGKPIGSIIPMRARIRLLAWFTRICAKDSG